MRFVDQGEMFYSVACPECQRKLDIEWWKGEMDRQYEGRFADLSTVTPCCNATTSLNDLDYDRPAGFARFLLVVEDYSLEETRARAHVAELEAIIGCPLRQTWAWY